MLKWMKFIIGWTVPVIIGLLIALIIGQFFGRQVILGASMSPTLKDHQIVYRLNRAKIRRNDVVSFHAQGIDKNQPTTAKTVYVKRVIGMPGDKIKYTKRGNLFVNGKLEQQSYITNKQQKKVLLCQ